MSRLQTTGAPQLPGLVYVQPLGSGGYADVYLYEQQSPRMPVAVKVLRSEGLTDALRRQFAEEADTMAALGDHPYIVQIFRGGTSADGRPYLVMKYYPPPNLARRARLKPLTVDEVLRTGIQLASAVETAHQAGIVHRDIKPANVLVSSYGAPGLTDFGIAGRGADTSPLSRPPSGDAEESAEVGVSVPWAPPEVLYVQNEGTPSPRRAGRRLLARGHALAAARRALAVRGPRRRQLGVCVDAPDPYATGPVDRPARRAAQPRADPRPVDGQGPRAAAGQRPGAGPPAPGRRAGAAPRPHPDRRPRRPRRGAGRAADLRRGRRDAGQERAAGRRPEAAGYAHRRRCLRLLRCVRSGTGIRARRAHLGRPSGSAGADQPATAGDGPCRGRPVPRRHRRPADPLPRRAGPYA